MARRTVEIFECDICHEEADRFTVLFPDGTLALDRCPEHSGPITSLKDEPGQWTATGSGKTPFRVTTPEEILAKTGRK